MDLGNTKRGKTGNLYPVTIRLHLVKNVNFTSILKFHTRTAPTITLERTTPAPPAEVRSSSLPPSTHVPPCLRRAVSTCCQY